MGECLIIRSGSGIDTSNTNATSETIVTGYTCYVNDELVTGSIPVKDIKETRLSPSEQIVVPYGYHSNRASISTSTLEEETVGSAVSSDLLEGYSGWTNGGSMNGSMPNKGIVTQSMTANSTYNIPTGWYSATSKITQTLNVQSAVTVTPGTTNKIACAANRWTNGNVVVAGNGNLASGNIKNGVIIFGVRGTFTGWVDNVSARYTMTDMYYWHWEGQNSGYHHCYGLYTYATVNTTGWNYFWVEAGGFRVGGRTDPANNLWGLNKNIWLGGEFGYSATPVVTSLVNVHNQGHYIFYGFATEYVEHSVAGRSLSFWFSVSK